VAAVLKFLMLTKQGYSGRKSKAWVTGTIFQDWFCSEFVPAVKAYLLQE
jgi:hypothetical protein